MSKQANPSFFIMTIRLLSVHLSVHSNAFGNLCLTVDFTGCRGFVQRQGSVCQNGLFLTPVSGKKQSGRDKKGFFFPSKQARQFVDKNSNEGSYSAFTMQLFLKAFSTSFQGNSTFLTL